MVVHSHLTEINIINVNQSNKDVYYMFDATITLRDLIILFSDINTFKKSSHPKIEVAVMYCFRPFYAQCKTKSDNN